MPPPRSTGRHVRSGAIRHKYMWAEASVRWLKSDSQTPHINQSRSIDPDASHGSLKTSAGYPDPLDVPPPFYPRYLDMILAAPLRVMPSVIAHPAQVK